MKSTICANNALHYGEQSVNLSNSVLYSNLKISSKWGFSYDKYNNPTPRFQCVFDGPGFLSVHHS